MLKDIIETDQSQEKEKRRIKKNQEKSHKQIFLPVMSRKLLSEVEMKRGVWYQFLRDILQGEKKYV